MTEPEFDPTLGGLLGPLPPRRPDNPNRPPIPERLRPHRPQRPQPQAKGVEGLAQEFLDAARRGEVDGTRMLGDRGLRTEGTLSMSHRPPAGGVRFALQVDRRTPRHVRVRLFAGPHDGTKEQIGMLMLLPDEYDALAALLAAP